MSAEDEVRALRKELDQAKARIAELERGGQGALADQGGEDGGYTPVVKDDAADWFSVTAVGGLRLGDRVRLPPSFCQVGDVAFRWCSTNATPEILARPPSDMREDFSQRLRSEAGRALPAQNAGGASGFRDQHGDELTGVEDPAASSATDRRLDVRILPIRYDEAGERWRLLQDSIGVVEQADFEDWPLDNLRSTKRLLTDLRRNNRTFMQSHSDWVEHSGVRDGGRSIHEHRVLSKALELALSYDQLALVNLASMEVLVKRRMLIEHAYQGRAATPSFAVADYFMGYNDVSSGAFVDPELERYAAKKLKERNELDKELRLKKEEAAARRPRNGLF